MNPPRMQTCSTKERDNDIRPVGVGECLRRIIGKTITGLLKEDIIHAVGTLQTCTGLESGIEAAIHAVRKSFEEDNSDYLLLVDTDNHHTSQSYSGNSLAEVYQQHEKEKDKYNQRVIDIEKSSFNPLVFTTTGGMAQECNSINKRLAEKIAEKRREPYACHNIRKDKA